MHEQNVLAGHLREVELAKQLDLDPRTLKRWKRERVGPPVTKIGRDVFYSVEGVRAWLKSREQPMVREGS